MITPTYGRYSSTYKLMEVIHALLQDLTRFELGDNMPYPGEVQWYVVRIEKKLGLNYKL